MLAVVTAVVLLLAMGRSTDLRSWHGDWDYLLDGSDHEVDLVMEKFPGDLAGLRALAHREAATRGLYVSTSRTGPQQLTIRASKQPRQRLGRPAPEPAPQVQEPVDDTQRSDVRALWRERTAGLRREQEAQADQQDPAGQPDEPAL